MKNNKQNFDKKYLILIFLFVLDITYSQTTFNKEIWPLKFITASGPILTKGDTIICIGYGTDHYSYHYYDAFFSKYGMQGNFIERNVDTLGNYDFQETEDAFWYKNNIVTVVGDGYYPDFLIYDSNTGDILKKKTIFINNNSTRTGHALGLEQIDSITFAGLFIFTSSKHKTKFNIVASIFNIKTGKVKNIEIKKDSTNDFPEFIKWTGEKLLIGSHKPAVHWSSGLQKYTQSHSGNIYEVDTAGTWEEVYVADSASGGIKKLIINKDKEYICASFKIKFHYYKNESKFRWHFNVFKLDSNYNKIWEKPWGMDYDFNEEFGQAGILEAEDKDGYILCGYQPNFPYTKQGYGYWNLSKETVDSMKEAGTLPMTIGVLQKINENGDSIWLRSYSVVTDTNLWFVNHIIKSVIHSPDGGYLLYGEIEHGPRPSIDTANQYPGWLLKVDKYGCLVPGCQDTTDTTSIVDILPDTGIMLYPNPVSDRLYIYQSKSGYTHYTITDISGHIIQKWSGNLPNHTYILDVGRYKPGVYILTVDREGERRAEKFVVER